jgi:ubiquinone/menaquinone biosynthesis C-methylase UbiE
MPTHPLANPFDDTAVAQRYEAWYAGIGREADTLEKAILGKMLLHFPTAHSILEIGCGTGHFTRWLAQRGYSATGVDIAEPMLNEARRLGGAEYLPGDALSLPFASQSYDITALITTLEFVPDPLRALAEAVRVARQGLLLGVLNRWSVLALRHRLSGKALWRAAGHRIKAITWRTTLWPLWPLWPMPGAGDLPLPWGGFIGMAVQLHEKGSP